MHTRTRRHTRKSSIELLISLKKILGGKTNTKHIILEVNTRVATNWLIDGENNRCNGTIQKVTKSTITIKYDDGQIFRHSLKDFWHKHSGCLIVEI